MLTDFSNIFSNNILSQSDYESCLNQNIDIMKKNLSSDKIQNIFSIIRNEDEVKSIESIAEDLMSKYDEFIVVGIGGSNLSGMAFHDISNPKKKIHFIDNVDPKKISKILNSIDYQRTKFIIITKSGNTTEILHITRFLLNTYKNLNPLFITENKESDILDIINRYGFEKLDWKNNIGGRYSCFNTNSLLIAAISGIQITPMLESINEVVLDIKNDNASFYKTAIIKHLLSKNGYHVNTIFCYSSCLASFNSWFIQLWSESLGQYQNAMLAHGSIGSIDQHSQMQLYLGGNKNNIFNIIDVIFDKELFISKNPTHYMDELKNIAILNNKFSEFLSSLFDKNKIAFIRNVMDCNANSLAKYMTYFTFEVLSIAILNNIDPFQQPHVDNSKSMLMSIVG
jgi:glucose-6-phosphate isomerase